MESTVQADIDVAQIDRAMERMRVHAGDTPADERGEGSEDEENRPPAAVTPALKRKRLFHQAAAPAAFGQMSPMQMLMQGGEKQPRATPQRSPVNLLQRQASGPLASAAIDGASFPPTRATSAPVPLAASSPAPTPISSSQYNLFVREAKSHEERECWPAALACYESAAEVRPPTEALEKKIRILRKKCAREAERRAAEEKEEEATRHLPVVHQGKFAFDDQRQVYIALAQEASSCAAPAATTLPSNSPRLTPYCLPAALYDAVYPYQRDAISWLWTLHMQRAGGVLADDMGLGKTVVCAAYLAGAFFSRQCKRVLLVAPLSVLGQWERELQKWAGASTSKSGDGLRLLMLTSSGSKSKQAAVESELRSLMTSPTSGGVVLTTYGLLAARSELFGASAFTNPAIQTWDLAALDEGHKIKNSETQLAKTLRTIPIARRLLLTGTPIMNDLDELWSLFDWTSHGTLLGDRTTFRQKFSRPIMAGIAKGASVYERDTGEALMDEVRKRIAPYFLRREKSILTQVETPPTVAAGAQPEEDAPADGGGADDGDSVGPTRSSSEPLPSGSSSSSSSVPSRTLSLAPPGPCLPPLPRLSVQKNDLILWLHLSPLQVSLYSSFLSSDRVKAIFTNSTRSPLVALSVLKKICDHPRLLSEEMKLCEDLDEIGRLRPLPAEATAAAASTSSASSASSSSCAVDALSSAVSMLTEESSKLRVLEQLLASHIAAGHRTLVFSQSRKMLAMISLLLRRHGWKALRIDGTVSDHVERQRRMDRFNRDTSFPVFLLTTRAGGVGLNLVGADRVVIFDPDWTPSLDNQAVDRAYRLGQQNNVVIYRLITCGTVEEVIYRKQVFKGSIIRAATSTAAATAAGSQQSADASVTRYFSQLELREVFRFDPDRLATYDQLIQMHPPDQQRKSYAELDRAVAAVERIEGVHGLTDHDLLFHEIAPPAPGSEVDPSSHHSAVGPMVGGSHRPTPSEAARLAVERMSGGEVASPERRRSKKELQREAKAKRSVRPDRSSQAYMFDLTGDSPEKPASLGGADGPVAFPFIPGGLHVRSSLSPSSSSWAPQLPPSPTVPAPTDIIAIDCSEEDSDHQEAEPEQLKGAGGEEKLPGDDDDDDEEFRMDEAEEVDQADADGSDDDDEEDDSAGDYTSADEIPDAMQSEPAEVDHAEAAASIGDRSPRAVAHDENRADEEMDQLPHPADERQEQPQGEGDCTLVYFPSPVRPSIAPTSPAPSAPAADLSDALAFDAHPLTDASALDLPSSPCPPSASSPTPARCDLSLVSSPGTPGRRSAEFDSEAARESTRLGVEPRQEEEEEVEAEAAAAAEMCEQEARQERRVDGEPVSPPPCRRSQYNRLLAEAHTWRQSDSVHAPLEELSCYLRACELDPTDSTLIAQILRLGDAMQMLA